jgi:hypothetical protein
VPSGITVISVITVGNAVQIKRSRLSSVATSITCHGYPDTRQVGVTITCNIVHRCHNTSQYTNVVTTGGNKKGDQSEDKEVDWKTILKWILRRVGTDVTRSELDPMAVSLTTVMNLKVQ